MAPVAMDIENDFLARVGLLSGQPVEMCYQCQKCSSGCPVAPYADLYPSQLLRLLQFGLRERALASAFIWLCSGCETCGARCPNGIRTAAVVDTLKEMALREKKNAPAERKVSIFHAAFLDSVRRFGRVHELSMLAGYKLRSGTLFQDLNIGRQYFFKGKFSFRPDRIRRTGEIKEIFRRASKSV